MQLEGFDGELRGSGLRTVRLSTKEATTPKSPNFYHCPKKTKGLKNILVYCGVVRGEEQVHTKVCSQEDWTTLGFGGGADELCISGCFKVCLPKHIPPCRPPHCICVQGV